MVAVTPADSTYAAIESMVRELTSSLNESQLSSADIGRAVNTYYQLDFPAACKLGQLRTNLEIFTEPYVDTYRIDINKYQGFGDPVMIEGYRSLLYKDQSIFFGQWPKISTKLVPWTGDGVTTTFSTTLTGAPLARQSITVGTIDTAGGTMRISDNGIGGFIDASSGLSTTGANPISQTAQSSGSTPNTYPTPTPIVGSINYVSGSISITFTNPPADGEPIIVWAYQYSVGQPTNVLFWNDQLTVRPVPNGIYRIELEAYQTPVQFMQSTETPILNAYWQLIAYGAAITILSRWQDTNAIQAILPHYEEQKALILNRNAEENIGVSTATIYTSRGGPYGWGGWPQWGNWGV